MNTLTVYLETLAPEFFQWFRLYFLGDAPLECGAVDDLGEWEISELYQDPDALIWSMGTTRVITETGGIIIDDAIYCLLTQIKQTVPRLKMELHWANELHASAWELLRAIHADYPEARAEIEAWQQTEAGRQAGLLFVAHKWRNGPLHNFHVSVLKAAGDAAASVLEAWDMLPDEQKDALLDACFEQSEEYHRELRMMGIDLAEAKREAESPPVEAEATPDGDPKADAISGGSLSTYVIAQGRCWSVLQALGEGMSNGEIAKKTGKRKSTVEKDVSKLYGIFPELAGLKGLERRERLAEIVKRGEVFEVKK